MLTSEEIMNGKQPDYPYCDTGDLTLFKGATRQEKDKPESKDLFK